MIKSVTVLSFLFMFVSTFFSNYTYASQYSLSNEPDNANVIPQAQNTLVGKIAETMNSGGYTYILLQTKTKQIWVAISKTDVSVGQNIVLMPGVEMKNFKSKSLDRTFESIIFSEGQISQGGPASGNVDSQKKAPGSNGVKPPSNENIKINKAMGANAYTVAELFEKRSELDKKEIVVRGQVVKVSAQIMGKNWLHIQDGTGDSQKGTNDIVATTMDLPSVGDNVTIKGILYSNKDFGSGYRYDAIIEQAHVTKYIPSY
jgi:hypothetical protein